MANQPFWDKYLSPYISLSWLNRGKSVHVDNFYSANFAWMLSDFLAAAGVSISAFLLRSHMGTKGWGIGLSHFNIAQIRQSSSWLAVELGFAFIFIAIAKGMNLYFLERIRGFLHEQYLVFQALFLCGLLETGMLYLLGNENTSRKIFVTDLCLQWSALGSLRFFNRVLLYRRFKRGVGTRNVLIVGSGESAHTLQEYVEKNKHLGYTVKGQFDFSSALLNDADGDEKSELDRAFQQGRRCFSDEIFLIVSGPVKKVAALKTMACANRVNIRIIPEGGDESDSKTPLEFIGAIPTIPVPCGVITSREALLKRAFDVGFSLSILLLLWPVLVLFAIVVRLDSPGPAFYRSKRIGKRGRVFDCIKFRTMVSDAEARRAELIHLNERRGNLFKISNDPRITRVGRFLRKYSLDELPQFLNVVRGQMSVVGPRPPLESEVREYELDHLRRLDVTPGITGLWQVRGRQNPSFECYFSLDVDYIEHRNAWLDLKIILRTFGVMFSGTGC